MVAGIRVAFQVLDYRLELACNRGIPVAPRFKIIERKPPLRAGGWQAFDAGDNTGLPLSLEESPQIIYPGRSSNLREFAQNLPAWLSSVSYREMLVIVTPSFSANPFCVTAIFSRRAAIAFAVVILPEYTPMRINIG